MVFDTAEGKVLARDMLRDAQDWQSMHQRPPPMYFAKKMREYSQRLTALIAEAETGEPRPAPANGGAAKSA